MFSNLGGWTGVILLVIILLVFAAPKLPMFAKNLSQSIRIFKDEMKPSDSAASSTPAQGTTGTTPASGATDAAATPAPERGTNETPSNGTAPNSTNTH